MAGSEREIDWTWQDPVNNHPLAWGLNDSQYSYCDPFSSFHDSPTLFLQSFVLSAGGAEAPSSETNGLNEVDA